MTIEENKNTIRRLYEAVDRQDVNALDQFISPQFTDHNPLPMPGVASGIAGLKQAFAAFAAAFPDSRHTIEDMVAEGDRVVVRVVGRGTHRREFMGAPASGREVAMEGIAVYRFKDGRIVEKWGQPDRLGVMMQLGVLSPPATPHR